MTQPIKLTDVIPIESPGQYKLHLACRNKEGVRPLDEYVADHSRWLAWNEWRGKRNDWGRTFIFSFMEFYPLTDAHLFGGVFEVKERLPDHYVLEEVEAFKKWEGRLVCSFHRYQGLKGRAFNLETLLERFDVLQVLPERYDGEPFCGYENINHSLGMLKALVDCEKQDWKAALSAVKGVYLVMDTATGKPYVGAAYSGAGIWSRLSCYVSTGHGWNDELVKRINEKGMEYALSNLNFSVLEIFECNTADDLIFSREAHWKRVMLAREFGYNRS